MKIFTVVAALLAALLGMAGCEQVTEPPDATTNIKGEITRIELDREIHGYPKPRVLIEEIPTTGEIEPETDGEKIWFWVYDHETTIEREFADGSTVVIRPDELQVGMRARAWHTGLIIDSYPQQATARRILVLNDE